MKLMSMIDFVFMVGNDENHVSYEKDLAKIYDYANFLKQPLKLEMFIPCDDEGNILEEVTSFDPDISSQYYSAQVYQNELYKQAKERVLFKGFYYQSNYSEKQNKTYRYVRNKHPHVFSFKQINDSTVEGLLVGYKKEFLIELTESALKQIGLCQ